MKKNKRRRTRAPRRRLPVARSLASRKKTTSISGSFLANTFDVALEQRADLFELFWAFSDLNFQWMCADRERFGRIHL